MNGIYFVIPLLLLIHLKVACNALDVSFIPNDENAPLPLSQQYRESLRKLCTLISKAGAKLPPEITEKKAVIKKMCSKLAADDANAGFGSSSFLPLLPSILQNHAFLLSLLGIGGGYALWCNRAWLRRQLRRNFSGGSPVLVKESRAGDASRSSSFSGTSSVVNTDRMSEVRRRLAETREARLKRFAEMNSVDKPSTADVAEGEGTMEIAEDDEQHDG